MKQQYIHTMRELLDLQKLPLEFKVEMAKDRIREFYEAMGGKCFVAFSGGKDSSVLLHLVRSVYPEVKAAYACTGIDYPDVAKFAMHTPNVDIVYPKKHFLRIVKEDGLVYPSKDVSLIVKDARRGVRYAEHVLKGENIDGTPSKSRSRFRKWAYLVDTDVKISDVCCKLLKEIPMAEYARDTGLFPFVGLLAEESFRRTKSWLTSGCNIVSGSNAKSKPLSFWTSQDILRYIVDNKLAIPSVYGDIVADEKGRLRTTGADRTGCMFCPVPLAHKGKLTHVKERYPKIYDTFINKHGLGEIFRKLGIVYE